MNNPYETRAPSNAALVRQTAEMCAQHGRRPATVGEARRILGLGAVTVRE
jgi:3-keto-5-aminohexanoate cleavage enzyme